jgi:peptidoglycan/xylan/chitin deacetylase (PgdA/CDA1 family)
MAVPVKELAGSLRVASARAGLRRRRPPTELVVLAYHGVDDGEQFRRQLELITKVAQPISGAQLVDAVVDGAPLPNDPVLLTFDDGYPSNRDAGLPALRDAGVPAVMFVTTAVLDSEQPFWWYEVEQRSKAGARVGRFPGLGGTDLVNAMKKLPHDERLDALEALRAATADVVVHEDHLRSDDLPRFEAAGVEIGNHTHHHPILARAGDDVVRAEIADAHERLTHVLGHAPRLFAYPSGSGDDRATAALRDAGYAAAFIFDHRVATLPVPDRYRISRVKVSTRTGRGELLGLLSGRVGTPR